MLSPDELLRAGYLSRPEQLVRVYELSESGSGLGRILQVSLYGGLQVNVHLDRGVDIGDTWYRGQLISWVSRIRDANALPFPNGIQWLSRFNGGLITTCGLENIGPPVGEHGLHGSFSHRRGHDVSYRREILDETVVCEITASIADAHIFGRVMTCYRTIRLEAGVERASITVHDQVVNEGLSQQPLAILYHVNLGYPVVQPGSLVTVNAENFAPREQHPEIPEASVFPSPLNYETEAVFEYTGFAGAEGVAEVRAPGAAKVRLAWQREELPKFFQWVYPSKSGWALGLEPGNAPMWGIDREQEHRGMKILAPGESATTDITVHLEI